MHKKGGTKISLYVILILIITLLLILLIFGFLQKSILGGIFKGI